ncbi:unnamed protein product [Microthlaspi erraticum]|uniref:Uncharacterized protein n=1 Tax=Microthlaspi erraticum TaxID=1685480 RepID=A0A6D2K641_9BRAS|nr:unnamed protein product [Microthlaspi erraticum]
MLHQQDMELIEEEAIAEAVVPLAHVDVVAHLPPLLNPVDKLLGIVGELDLNRLISMPFAPDYKTQEPLDQGFKAIAMGCKDLQRLSVSGLLTDKSFEYIGKHAKNLGMLSIAFAGDVRV